MRTFADAFAEPRETGREFKAEVGDESALLQLCITSDGDELKWEFRTAALAWSDSVQVVRDTFIQPLVEVKQQLETQKLDLVETVLNQSQASAADFGGQHAGGGRRMYGAHGSAAPSGGSDFSLDEFDGRTVAVRSSKPPRPAPPYPPRPPCPRDILQAECAVLGCGSAVVQGEAEASCCLRGCRDTARAVRGLRGKHLFRRHERRDRGAGQDWQPRRAR